VYQRSKHHGFTLIEVLIALAIFSVMSMMAYGGLKTVLNARNGTERAAERLREIQMAFILIQQDMQHMMPRSIRNENGEPESALEEDGATDYQITFTRGGNSNPRRPRRSGLYRVAYQLEDSDLKRFVWYTLDRAQGNTPQEMVLLRGVSAVNFNIDEDPSSAQSTSQSGFSEDLPEGFVKALEGGATNEELANLGTGQSGGNLKANLDDKLPKSVEMVVVLEDWGTLTRLFAMPQ